MKKRLFVKGMLILAAAFSFAGCQTKETKKVEEKEVIKIVQPKVKTEEEKKEESAKEPTGSVEGGKKYLADIVVKDYGTITVELDEGIAPKTVQNFVKLAKEGYYNGTTFHRIIDGFMIQGGAGAPTEQIEGEFKSNGFNNTLKHTAGVISMARNANPNSASSGFFIVEEDSPHLDGQYAGFGHVTEGMDIVHKIAEDAKPVDNNGSIPQDQQPVIESITITEE